MLRPSSSVDIFGLATFKVARAEIDQPMHSLQIGAFLVHLLIYTI